MLGKGNNGRKKKQTLAGASFDFGWEAENNRLSGNKPARFLSY
jgi:hypothetical protein